MFISTKQLVTQYGIDNTIARFFVDRDPPANNLYWQEKLLYLRPSPGYLFIPLIVDLLHKLGIDKEKLLSAEFLGCMEDIGHISALEETTKISRSVAIEKCEELVRKQSVNENWLNTVIDYFKGKKDSVLSKAIMPFNSLHRGDIFLFSLATIDFPDTFFQRIAEQWFALIGILLLLDDADDIEIDKAAGDENAFLESGLSTEGIEQINQIVKLGLKRIATVNPILSAALDRQYRVVGEMNFLKHLNPHA
jgi:hypothetical protein